VSAAPKLNHEYLIGKLDELPTLPTIIYELSQIISDPMSSTSDVEKIMENDVSLTTKVLRLVNSAYYSIPGGVGNLRRAIAYIGFDTVHQLILSASIINALDIKDPRHFDIKQFWTHSVGVGIAAEIIAKTIGHAQPSDLFTCGLIHDMGKLALYTIDATSVSEIIHNIEVKNLSYLESEMDLGLPTHCEIGKMLAEKWRLPLQTQTVILYHHQPNSMKRGGVSADLSQSVDIILLANLLTHALKFGHSGHKKILNLNQEIMQRLSIDPQQGLKNLIRQIKVRLKKAVTFINIISGGN